MKKSNGSDMFQTPVDALEPLYDLIGNRIVWEPSKGKGNIVNALEHHGIEVIGTDISTGFDFFEDQPNFNFDCIITNPPFSLKNEYIKKCYSYGKPFALLLPLNALETNTRQQMFEKHGIEIILFNYRLVFETPSGKKSSPWQAHAWFTHGFGLGKELNFHKKSLI